MISTEAFHESRFESRHSIEIRGKTVDFTAIAEDFVFTDELGEAEASIFSYSYLADAENPEARPVLFAWNGGPGASAAASHLRFFGPWRIKPAPDGFLPVLPPYELEDNPNSLLDVCDIVLVDPVGTGYGKLLKPERYEKYFSIEADAKSIAAFIEGWLTEHRRWNSPKYLAGASYGTTRCVRVADELGSGFLRLNTSGPIALNGLILIGNATCMNEAATSILPEGVEPTLLFMDTMAGTNWYHHPELHDQSIDSFVAEAKAWANDALAAYFAAPDTFSPAALADLSETMSRYTGLPASLLAENGLRVNDASLFITGLLADRGLDIGVYDARLTAPHNELAGTLCPSGDDAAMGRDSASEMAIMSSELKRRLGMDFNRRFCYVNYKANSLWGFSFPKTFIPELPPRNHNQCLAAAMRRNPEMRVLFASGYFDLASWAGTNEYTAKNFGFPQDRTAVRVYPSGHDVFESEEGAVMFADDVRALLAKEL